MQAVSLPLQSTHVMPKHAAIWALSGLVARRYSLQTRVARLQPGADAPQSPDSQEGHAHHGSGECWLWVVCAGPEVAACFTGMALGGAMWVGDATHRGKWWACAAGSAGGCAASVGADTHCIGGWVGEWVPTTLGGGGSGTWGGRVDRCGLPYACAPLSSGSLGRSTTLSPPPAPAPPRSEPPPPSPPPPIPSRRPNHIWTAGLLPSLNPTPTSPPLLSLPPSSHSQPALPNHHKWSTVYIFLTSHECNPPPSSHSQPPPTSIWYP